LTRARSETPPRQCMASSAVDASNAHRSSSVNSRLISADLCAAHSRNTNAASATAGRYGTLKIRRADMARLKVFLACAARSSVQNPDWSLLRNGIQIANPYRCRNFGLDHFKRGENDAEQQSNGPVSIYEGSRSQPADRATPARTRPCRPSAALAPALKSHHAAWSITIAM
jgi:hypothetical protein